MEEMKGLVRSYSLQGLTVSRSCQLVGISTNQYYHKSKGTKQGRRPSEATKHIGGKAVPNEMIVAKMISINSESEDIKYGYIKMTSKLQYEGYIINKKKVERLMREQGMLQIIKREKNKKYVKYRKANAKDELEIIEIDIKYKYITGTKSMAYIMTIIDTFTRRTLYWTVGYNMKKHQVCQAWEYVIVNELQQKRNDVNEMVVEVRSDNGKQFEATIVKKMLRENKIDQVFTHPYTPEENGHIESFHAILGKSIDHLDFEGLSELEERLNSFYEDYNQKRIHGSTCNLPPNIFRELWIDKKIKLIEDKKKNEIRFKLLIPMYGVNQYLQNKKKNDIG
jgi:transposase InsO family protein